MNTPTRMTDVRIQAWGQVPPGDVRRYTLSNASGVSVVISDLGAALLSWLAPDRDGRLADVLLGFDHAADYWASGAHMGGLIGRWANRIAGARFRLDGTEYQLAANDGPNLLHGGEHGFDRAIWRVAETPGAPHSLRLVHVSAAGDAGFPGNLTVVVDYRLDDDNTLTIDYTANSDAPTPINLTSHGYFNLAGGGPAADHVVTIDAERFLEVDRNLIPVGARDVAGTAFDWRHGAAVGARLASGDARIVAAGGFDTCYCVGPIHAPRATLDTSPLAPARAVATAYEPVSGRELTVSTTAWGVQFYTGNNLEGVLGKGGRRYHRHDALCFEAQAYPNQINGADAAAVVLRPGHTFRQTTAYRIGVRR